VYDSQPEKDRKKRHPEKDSQNRIDNKTAMAGHPGQGCQNRAVSSGLLG
jgi:hypothetical protein